MELHVRIAMLYVHCRDVTTGTTGATTVTPKFSDTLTLFQPRGQILPTITKVTVNIFPWLRPCTKMVFLPSIYLDLTHCSMSM